MPLHCGRRDAAGGELFGKAFENWVFHELVAANAYHEAEADLSYWRLASGIEVDFIVGNMGVAIEANASARIGAAHFNGLRHLAWDAGSEDFVLFLEELDVLGELTIRGRSNQRQKGMEKGRHLGIVAICNLERCCTFLVQRPVVISPPEK